MLKVKDLLERLKKADPEAIISIDIGENLTNNYYIEGNYDIDFIFDENRIELYENEIGEQRVYFNLKEIDTSELKIEEQKEKLGYYPLEYPPIEIWKRKEYL